MMIIFIIFFIIISILYFRIRRHKIDTIKKEIDNNKYELANKRWQL